MQLANEVHPKIADEMLAFYKNHFAYVAVVFCNECDNPIAVMVGSPKQGDWMGLRPNDAGLGVVAVEDWLLSSRVRLDRGPNGEPMLGFQCNAPMKNPEYDESLKQHKIDLAEYDRQYKADSAKSKEEIPYLPPEFMVEEFIRCKNNTLMAEPEIGLVPVGLTPVNYSNPFEKHRIAQHIAAHPTYKADYEHNGHIKRYEKFRAEEQ